MSLLHIIEHKDYKKLLDEIQNLHAKVQYLVDYAAKLSRTYGDRDAQFEDGCFTFPDGDTWYATGHEPKPENDNIGTFGTSDGGLPDEDDPDEYFGADVGPAALIRDLKKEGAL